MVHSARDLAEKLTGTKPAFYAADLTGARALLDEHGRPGDVIIVMGAGDITNLGADLVA